MKMDEGIDTGDIIARRSIAIEEQETTTSLMDKLAHLGAELLIETLPGYLSGEIEPSPQEEDGATYAGMIKKKDGLIHFDQPADQIERMVRALDPWPNAYFDWDGKYVKIFSAKVLPSKNLASGQRGVVDQYPVIGTATADLMLLEVQVPGKNRFDGKVFLNGARNW
jgi:methionyl-tRNA formyltransferase